LQVIGADLGHQRRSLPAGVRLPGSAIDRTG